MIFTNGRLIFPDRIVDGLGLRVINGRIAEIGDFAPWDVEEEIVDLRGSFLAPGFIDLHVHGALGRDTMEGTPEAFRAICEYHAAGGTSSLLLTTVTAPIAEIVRVVRQIEAARADLCSLRGAHIEGPFISPRKRGAQSAAFVLQPTPPIVAELLDLGEVLQRVTLAPEIAGARDFISSLTTAGVAASGGHSDAWEEDATAAFELGMRQVTHTFNCMSSMRRRNGARVAGLLEFALSEPKIFCELIADGKHVGPTLMRMLYQAKGASGICLVTDATAGAGLPDESRFQLGDVECIVREGACWTADGSALAGSAARMIDLVREMVEVTRAPLVEAVRMATETPARAMGWKSKGMLAVGMDADLVVLSPELEVLQTFSGGVPLKTRGIRGAGKARN